MTGTGAPDRPAGFDAGMTAAHRGIGARGG